MRLTRLVAPAAVLLAPLAPPLGAQEASSAGGAKAATEAGPWAVQATVQAGALPRVGVLRLVSPRVAVLLDVDVAASRDVTTNDRVDPFAEADADTARYADRTVNRQSGLGLRAGVRLYGAPIARGRRGAAFVTVGVLGASNRFSYRRETDEPGVDDIANKIGLLTFGSYAEAGATAMLTPRLAVGASGQLVATVSVDDRSDNRQRTVYFRAPALVVTAFF